MAVCLDTQAVYVQHRPLRISLRLQATVAICLFAALALKVWVKFEINSLGYEIGKQREVSVELDMRRRELELERSVLMRPDVLASAARSRLGLKPLAAGQVAKLSQLSQRMSEIQSAAVNGIIN